MGSNMKMWEHIRYAYGKLFHVNNKATIEFRHVKAHSGVDDKRSYVNEWCDKEAKRRLRTIS